MEKPKPGTKIIQKTYDYHEYEVVSDEETEQSIDDNRFAVKPVDPTHGDDVGTFPISVLTQDNIFIYEG